jgi:hypothetical protein
MFELDNVKKERILRDVLEEWKVECRANDLVPTRFAKVLRTSYQPRTNTEKVLRRLPRESDAKSYKVLHLSRKIIFANLKMFQNATSLRKSAA